MTRKTLLYSVEMGFVVLHCVTQCMKIVSISLVGKLQKISVYLSFLLRE